ncbi:hypothetical protein [Morganella morganii IS15]|nr:hypothetical protein CSB69_3979 [Morganella morganii]CDK64296.1 hypothetical protein [Morganella morganii IS15]
MKTSRLSRPWFRRIRPYQAVRNLRKLRTVTGDHVSAFH